MGINFKEKFQNINKKVVAAIILILLIAIVCGLFAFKHVNDKKKAAEAQRIQVMEQQAKEVFRQRQQAENAEQPKKPSEYAVGIDYNKAMKGGKPVLTLFYADWCRYCIRFMPIFEKIAEKYGDEIILAKVNVEDPNYEKLVKEMRIGGFPTVFILDPKYDNKVLIGNSHLGTVDDLSVEVDRFIRIRKLLDNKK